MVDSHTRTLLVLVEITLEREGLPTPRTNKRLAAAMRLDMGPQITLIRKRLRTDWTPERLLAGMCPHVSLQEPRSGEAFPAIGASAALRVGADVHGERRG